MTLSDPRDGVLTHEAGIFLKTGTNPYSWP